MPYQKPMVQVYQEYAATSGTSVTASLPACIIGPCYHIIDADSDETLAHAGTYTSAGIENAVFPNNQPGALIDGESVKFRLANASVNLMDAPVSITGFFSGNSLLFFGQADFIDTLKVGDYASFDVESTYTYRVTDVDPVAKAVLLNRSIPEDATTIMFSRRVENVYMDAKSAGVTVDANSELYSLAGLKADIDGVERSINDATLYIGYKALRQDLSSVTTIQTVDEIEGKLGKVVPENPLAYGVMVCLSNTTTSVMCIGVDSDDLPGYTAAKDKLETVDPLYSMVPLTTSTEVLTMFKNSAEQMADPEIDMWRIAIGSSVLQTEQTKAEGFGKCSKDSNEMNLLFTATRGLVSTATGAEQPVEFMSSSVDAGDTLNITYKDKQYTYTVSSVAAEDILTITPSSPFAEELVTDSPEVSFTITHTMDKSEQASAVAAVSQSYGSSRFVHVWPDICVIDERELPGYYLACAVAGGIAGLPSHYGFTNLSMSGIGGVKHSNDYFSQDQLNTIAGGGTFIFVQETEESAPYVRHQLTTDMSTVEFQELSFVKNYDYVSYICRDVLRPYIGTWNVTSAALSAISTSLSAALESLKLDVQAQIGAPIVDYAIRSIGYLEDNRTRVEAYVDVTFPYPLNTIGLHLVSQ
ncbi:hypothetical protein B5F76_05760 [Desulfovibrio sp. An276]|uniref:hypothetical protein n=1 Tax=Desulfovibrio sp. An276 TaxID=1965618 RepID=UPI000B39828E|nr:hypothetical protein [Desulfovibrio sp. An276]OUO53282.1 hypothetical protein B5F76_05760 [Desulfovibrio sp. An276]